MKKSRVAAIVLVCVFTLVSSVSVFADFSYTVESGDVLWKIADKFGVSYKEIAKANNITNPNKIYAGQKLVIPEGQQAVTQGLATPGAKIRMASVNAPANLPQPDGFRVTVIGSGLPKMDLAKGTQSILVQYKDKLFLVDCGYNAVFGLMDRGVKIEEITNMLFTHQHADHNVDYWSFLQGGWGEDRFKLNLVGPNVQKLQDITLDFYKGDLDYRIDVVGTPSDGMRTNVNITEFTNETESLELDGVKITAMQVPHAPGLLTYAYRFEAGGQSVVISGDLTYTEEFAPFAKNADILVMDGLMTEDFSHMPEAIRTKVLNNLSKAHLMNEDIAKVTSDAAPKNLVLVHWQGVMDLDANIKLYREAGYKGEVIKSVDGLVIEP